MSTSSAGKKKKNEKIARFVTGLLPESDILEKSDRKRG